MNALPDPLTADSLAASDAMANGEWRDADGRNLIAAVIHALGVEAGRRLWREAEALFLARVGRPGQASLPVGKARSTAALPADLRLVTSCKRRPR